MFEVPYFNRVGFRRQEWYVNVEFGLQKWALPIPWNLTWQLWQSARPQNRDVKMGKVGISDYMTIQLIIQRFQRQRFSAAKNTTTFCCFSPYVESPQRNREMIWRCNPTTTGRRHTALITSHDGCPAGEGCSRIWLHRHAPASYVMCEILVFMCWISLSKHTVHTSMYILINVIYTYIDIYIYLFKI